MLYIGKFNNIEGELISVEIVTEGTTGTKELVLTGDPVTISSTSEDGLFSAIKGNSATIRVLTTSIYPDMYSSKATQTPVKIMNLTTGKVIFRGYLTPNIYSQEYVGLDELELEAISGISTLKNIKYKEISEVVSWYDIIKTGLQKVGYNKFYLSDTYTVNPDNDFLKEIYQFEENFFDDDDERTPWTYYEILSEFCKYFCLTLVLVDSEVFFIDYKNLINYKIYDLTNDTVVSKSFNYPYIISGNSYRKTGADISFDETFNKVEVKVNLYSDDEELTPFSEKDLVNQNTDPNKYYIGTVMVDESLDDDKDPEEYTYLNAYFFNTKWETVQNVPEITPDNIKNLGNSSFIQKATSFKTEEDPASLSWDTYLTVHSLGDLFAKYTDFLITKPKTPKTVVFNKGYFIANIDFMFSDRIYPNECFDSFLPDQMYSDNKYSNPIEDTRFPCRLYVGDFYFDGDEWVNKSEYQRKLFKGYYRGVDVTAMGSIPTWYKYKDIDGDWVFCNKKEWDLQTGVKESGKVKDKNKVFYFNGPTGTLGDRIYIDEYYYNECRLEDRFWLVRKNKKDERIFGEEKSLTNTVSWRMNIDDSEEGVAIKLPNFVLNGKLIFEVYSPDVLGNYGQYRTDLDPKKVTDIHITRLSLSYKSSDKNADLFDIKKDNEDILYTNIIDDDYVNEWDSIELKVNTQPEDRVTSFSSVLYKDENDKTDKYKFLDKVTDLIYKVNRIQEENIIQRYYDHYHKPTVILTACLRNSIYPISNVVEYNLHKTLLVDSYEINVADNSNVVKLIEY